MKLAKIFITLFVTSVVLLSVSCVSNTHAPVDAFDMTPEMWDAVEQGQPAKIKGTVPARTITYTTEMVSASSEQVFVAAVEVLSTIDAEEVPQIMRAEETGKALVPTKIKIVKTANEKDFDNTKRGELLATYKTKKLALKGGDSSAQDSSKRTRVVVLPQSDGTTKIGVYIGKSVSAYNVETLLSKIKEKL